MFSFYNLIVPFIDIAVIYNDGHGWIPVGDDIIGWCDFSKADRYVQEPAAGACTEKLFQPAFIFVHQTRTRSCTKIQSLCQLQR